MTKKIDLHKHISLSQNTMLL